MYMFAKPNLTHHHSDIMAMHLFLCNNIVQNYVVFFYNNTCLYLYLYVFYRKTGDALRGVHACWRPKGK